MVTYLAPALLLSDDAVNWPKPIKLQSNPPTEAYTHSPTICHWHKNKRSQSAKKAHKKRKELKQKQQKLEQLTRKHYKNIKFDQQVDVRKLSFQDKRQTFQTLCNYQAQIQTTAKVIPFCPNSTKDTIEVFLQDKQRIKVMMDDRRRQKRLDQQGEGQDTQVVQPRQPTPDELAQVQEQPPAKKTRTTGQQDGQDDFGRGNDDDDEYNTPTFEELQKTFLSSCHALVHHYSVDPDKRLPVFNDLMATARINCFPTEE